MTLRSRVALAAALIMLLVPGLARASGGEYRFSGGTPAERATVRAALNASSFDWNLVPERVTIHIARGIAASHSTPGQSWLDANLLDAGTFAWGVVDMEYAQQVQFALAASQHAQLLSSLGGRDWCYETPNTPLVQNACERFAATLAWVYWPSQQNCMKPASATDISASMPPRAFRALVAQLFAAQQPAQQTSTN